MSIDTIEIDGMPLAVAGSRIEWRNGRPTLVLLGADEKPAILRLTRVIAATGERVLCWEGPVEVPAGALPSVPPLNVKVVNISDPAKAIRDALAANADALKDKP